MAEVRNRRVVFIGGAGHSGSTLLGLALGSHPDVFYAGEARKSRFLGDPGKPERKRTCKVCGPGCPVWTDLPCGPDVDVYEALSRRTGRATVVDSSKSVDWLRERSAGVLERGADAVLVLLLRDGRAVLGSRLRKYPDVPAAEHARRWCAQIEAMTAFAASFAGPVVRVRYEELATRPDRTLRAVANAMGLPFDAAMLDPFGAEHHPLGGNAGTQSLLRDARTRVGGPLAIDGAKRAYYESHPRAFVLDLRWKRELSAEALAEFEAVAGDLNRAYAWDEEGS